MRVLKSLVSLVHRRTVRFECIENSSVIETTSPIGRTLPRAVWRLQPVRTTCSMPAGVVKIKVDVEGVKSRISIRLFYRTSQGFTENENLWLVSDHAGRVVQQALLPTGVRELILVFGAGTGHATPTNCSITEVGTLETKACRYLTIIRHYLANPWIFSAKARRALHVLRTGGIAALREQLRKSNPPNYSKWVARFDTLSDADRRTLRQEAEHYPYRPVVSIVLPVKDPPISLLQQAIDSVRSQIYTNWELCIADDNSANSDVRSTIQEYAELDSRIRYVFRPENGHISEATNSAAGIARGEWLGLLDHDDILREHALSYVVRELNTHSETDLLYSDEDKITEHGLRHCPHFKTSWNPELILSHNYVCHFLVVRSSLFARMQGMRSACDGAQDWDFVLRASETTPPQRIRHIPRILYHWRVHSASTAVEVGVKPYISTAQIRAVSDHLARTGNVGATVEQRPGMHALRVRYPIPTPPPLISLIVPTRNQVNLTRECVDGLLNRTNYRNIEILIVDNGSDDPETLDWLRSVSSVDSRVVVLRDDRPFNYSLLNNWAARHARGTILGFVNNDIQVIHPEWLDEMVSHVARSTIAAVGARLLYPNGTIQHAGVITGIGGVAGHPFKGLDANSAGYFYRARLPQDLSAVTAACMLVRRDIFDQVGGFDEEQLAVAFNDVDLCLKIREAGYRIVYTPYAELLHHESASRGYENNPEKQRRFEQEVQVMKNRWGNRLVDDPFYNCNLSLESERFDLSPTGPRLLPNFSSRVYG